MNTPFSIYFNEEFLSDTYSWLLIRFGYFIDTSPYTEFPLQWIVVDFFLHVLIFQIFILHVIITDYENCLGDEMLRISLINDP